MDDAKARESWVEGFIAKAAEAGLDEEQATALMKHAARMELACRHPEAFEAGVKEAGMDKDAIGPLAVGALAAAPIAALGYGGYTGIRDLHRYFKRPRVPSDPGEKALFLQQQQQALRQKMAPTFRSLYPGVRLPQGGGRGGGGGGMYGYPGYWL